MNPAQSAGPCTPDEMMTVTAARMLWDGCVCLSLIHI